MKYGRTAFVVGVMFTIGTQVGKSLIQVTNQVAEKTLKSLAQNGNERAQKVCSRVGIRVDDQQIVKDSVIGFKAN